MTMARFWEEQPLAAMTLAQWEALCDGCARCCLQKLEDEDSGDVFYTRLACDLLNIASGRCTDYRNRHRLVPDCIALTAERLQDYYWLPETCAYRRLAAGQPLPVWHPLLTGNPESVHEAGISVRGRAIPCRNVTEDEWEDHIVDWVEVP
jgi:uncharacterized cysteine cluster protein YcgN (CxxCxxCC family)